MVEKKSKGPTGKERMRRIQPPYSRPNVVEHDVKKAYSSEQLTEIGAISLIWNQIEISVEWLILITLNLSPALWLDVTKRIFGMEGKIDILKNNLN